MTQLYVQVVNGEMAQCWDTTPPADEAGWKEAIEVKPEIVANRQGYTSRELPRPKGKRLSVFKEGASGFIKGKQFSN